MSPLCWFPGFSAKGNSHYQCWVLAAFFLFSKHRPGIKICYFTNSHTVQRGAVKNFYRLMAPADKQDASLKQKQWKIFNNASLTNKRCWSGAALCPEFDVADLSLCALITDFYWSNEDYWRHHLCCHHCCHSQHVMKRPANSQLPLNFLS